MPKTPKTGPIATTTGVTGALAGLAAGFALAGTPPPAADAALEAGRFVHRLELHGAELFVWCAGGTLRVATERPGTLAEGLELGACDRSRPSSEPRLEELPRVDQPPDRTA